MLNRRISSRKSQGSPGFIVLPLNMVRIAVLPFHEFVKLDADKPEKLLFACLERP